MKKIQILAIFVQVMVAVYFNFETLILLITQCEGPFHYNKANGHVGSIPTHCVRVVMFVRRTR